MIKIQKCVYVLYIFHFFTACEIHYMLCDPNELVDKRFLVTRVPASQSSVKTIKKCLFIHILGQLRADADKN